MNTKSKKVKIICPECGSIQNAEIKFGIPWNTYIHDCEKCGFTIMESEWNEIKTKQNVDQRI
jgi:ribosomal protein S27E